MYTREKFIELNADVMHLTAFNTGKTLKRLLLRVLTWMYYFSIKKY